MELKKQVTFVDVRISPIDVIDKLIENSMGSLKEVFEKDGKYFVDREFEIEVTEEQFNYCSSLLKVRKVLQDNPDGYVKLNTYNKY